MARRAGLDDDVVEGRAGVEGGQPDPAGAERAVGGRTTGVPLTEPLSVLPDASSRSVYQVPVTTEAVARA